VLSSVGAPRRPMPNHCIADLGARADAGHQLAGKLLGRDVVALACLLDRMHEPVINSALPASSCSRQWRNILPSLEPEGAAVRASEHERAGLRIVAFRHEVLPLHSVAKSTTNCSKGSTAGCARLRPLLIQSNIPGSGVIRAMHHEQSLASVTRPTAPPPQRAGASRSRPLPCCRSSARRRRDHVPDRCRSHLRRFR
jgi:hypothetical protein